MKVPENTVVVYCYTVYNQGSTTPTHHTLIDSHWGTLFAQRPLLLEPDSLDTYMISRVVNRRSVHVATWLSENRLGLVTARSFTAEKRWTSLRDSALQRLLAVAAVWFDSYDTSTVGSNTAVVDISSLTDDQDGDGITDNEETADDFDNDRIPNSLDPDSDADGYPDSEEGSDDENNDGNPDYLDPGWPLDPTGVDPIYLPLIRR